MEVMSPLQWLPLLQGRTIADIKREQSRQESHLFYFCRPVLIKGLGDASSQRKSLVLGLSCAYTDLDLAAV